jgi:biopolymer transport protein ExbB
MPSPILANAVIDLFHNGGPIMWPIAVVTIFAIAVIAERSWWWLQLAR